MSSPKLEPRLTAFAQTISEEALSATIRPERRVNTSGEHVLFELEQSRRPREPGRLILRETIGEGGMGVVRLAEQKSVGREVAVKTLKPGIDPKDGAVVLAMLREAWVTGRLEHPNIVPIYDVSVDEDGRPLIVLKKIEGVVWSDVMQGNAERTTLSGARDALASDLEILNDVADAVRYAHSRGIIHRDIKPDNVMIGRFGEVYLVDWGIAVSLREDGDGRVTSREESSAIAGTPVYMAPEMLEGGRFLSERTDIYLLGAVLYELVVGRPPHGADTSIGVVAAIAASEPEIPQDVPADLRAILQKALARDPDDRYQSVFAFQQALAELADHRQSRQLSTEASRRLADLRQHLDGADGGGAERAHDLFGECRFGFRNALELWPDNAAAATGLAEAVGVMVELELKRDDPAAAATHLRALAAPSPELVARVEAAAAAQRRDDARLQAQAARGRSEDPSRGRRGRVFVATAAASILAAAALAGGILFPGGRDYGPALLIGSPTVVGAVVLGLIWLQRETIMATAFNRRAVALVVTAVVAVPLMHLGSALGGLDPVQSHIHGLMIYVAVCIAGAMILDKRFAATAGVMLGCYLVAARWPSIRFYALAVGGFSVALTIAWVWSRDPAEDD